MNGSAEAPAGRDLVFIGDVHLGPQDPENSAFLGLLESLVPTTRGIVLLGDLFDLWLGDRRLEQPHHLEVAEKLADLRRRGVRIRYVEGNRDYRIAEGYVGWALDEATDRGIVEHQAGRSFLAIHGDLTNPADRRYRAWRAFSRSAALWWCLKRIPARTCLAVAERLEARMRTTNPEFKRRFPSAAVRDYAAALLADGTDALVLGHFHIEHEFMLPIDGVERRVYVLPEWKGSHRHLRIDDRGQASLVDWSGVSSRPSDPSNS